jgi:hypothetical protein
MSFIIYSSTWWFRLLYSVHGVVEGRGRILLYATITTTQKKNGMASHGQFIIQKAGV